MMEVLERRAIISGVGQSAIGRRLFREELDLTCEAALEAIADAGLTADDIDGVAAYPGPIQGGPGFAGPGIYDVQDALGIDVRWQADRNAFTLHQATSGTQISPSSALAAAVATEER